MARLSRRFGSRMIAAFSLPPPRNIFLSLEPGVNANVRAPNDVDRSGGAVIFHPRLPTRRAPRVLPHLRMHQWRIGRGCFLITCHNSPPTRPSTRRGMGDQATGFFSDRKRRVYTRVIIATRRLRALGVTLIRSNREQKETAGNRDPGSSHSSSTRKGGKERGRSRWIALNRVLRNWWNTAWIRWMPGEEFSRFPASRPR